MSRKIFRGIWGTALTVFLASLVFIMGLMHSYLGDVQRNQLRAETELAAQGVTLSGEAYFEGLDDSGFRITWIAADGTVLYDNEADSSTMENHLARKEVQDALNTGMGESSRYSSTLSEKLLYCACLLPDGTVIRLAAEQSAIWVLLLGFAQPICIVGVIALGMSFFLASRISRRIIQPINNMNPETPREYLGKPEYSEIEPLLRSMAAQQAQVRRSQTELEKTSKIRQEFTANASHELKTPLHVISGYAELLENGMVKEEDIRPFAGRIRHESTRMAKLVEDIIDLTRLDGGGTGMERELTDLLRVAQNAADTLRSTAEEKNITLTVTGDSAVISGVPQVLYSIVYNLCDNGIKYNRPGGNVSVAVQDGTDRVTLRVSDTGIGIPAEHLDRIFERFYRVDKSRSKEVGGTGLGLSIVKHGAMIHNAKVSVNSTPGVGSEFTLVFPKSPDIKL